MRLSHNNKGTLVLLVILLAVVMFAFGYRVCELLG
jgi:cbb3-type cytochrome oxidase subunit 3